MSPTRKFTIRLACYTAFLLYLVGDLFLWHGFLANRIDSYFRPIPRPAGDNSKLVAEVYGEPITANQLAHREVELSVLCKPPVNETPEGFCMTYEQDKKGGAAMARYDLICSSLLRLKSGLNDLQLPNKSNEAKKVVEQIHSRFDNEEEYLKLLHGQKLSEQQLQGKIAARLKQTEHLLRASSSIADFSEDDARVYYDLVKDRLRTPDVRSVKHIFLSSLNKNDAQVKSQAESILARIRNGEPFGELARTFSEDERSASLGGYLGKISLPQTEETLGIKLDADLVPPRIPTLVKGRWGWHVIEAGEIEKGHVPSYEESLPQLKSAIQSLRRAQAVDLYMEGVLEDAHDKQRIKIK